MAGNRDAQSHALCKLNQNNCKQNSPWELMYVGGTHCFEQAMDWWLWRRGSINLYYSVWKLPIMHVVWKILGTLGCYVDNEIIPLKKIYLYFKNWALAPLQIPASLCEGPIFYFMSFTLCKSQGDLHLSLFNFILWQALHGGVILIYISNWM